MLVLFKMCQFTDLELFTLEQFVLNFEVEQFFSCKWLIVQLSRRVLKGKTEHCQLYYNKLL